MTLIWPRLFVLVPERLPPVRSTPAFWLLAAVLLPSHVAGQEGRAQVQEGNRLYSEGRFDDAHQKYLEALLEDPESSLIRFNDGNALYQNQDFQRAMERFLEAAESGDPELRNAAWYNLGNALFRAQQLQESLDAYKQALRTNPSDTDAKHNLERVLEQMQQEEQQQQEQGEGEDQQEEQESENQQAQGQQDPQNQDPPQPQGDQPPEDEPDEGDQPEGGEPDTGEEPQEGQDDPQSRPGEMTPEEAEQLLNAIREDPGDVNRKRAPAAGKRPRKDW